MITIDNKRTAIINPFHLNNYAFSYRDNNDDHYPTYMRVIDEMMQRGTVAGSILQTFDKT